MSKKISLDPANLLQVQQQLNAMPDHALHAELQRSLEQIKKTPKHPMAYFVTGMMYSKAGEQNIALKTLSKALKYTDTPEIILGAIAIIHATKLKDYRTALKWLKKKSISEKNKAGSWLMMANCHMELAEPDIALEFVEKAEPNTPDKLHIHVLKSRCYFRLGDSQKARKEYDKIKELSPSGILSIAHEYALLRDNNESQLLELKLEVSEAIKKHSDKFRDDLHHCQTLVALGNISQQLGEFEEAFEFYSQANLKQPMDQYSSPHTKTGEFEIIKEVFNKGFFQSMDDCHPSTEQVFVLGMPRSGTTLIESILGAHSKVVDFGELDFFTKQMHLIGITRPSEISKEKRLQHVSQNLASAPENGYRHMGDDFIQMHGFDKLKGKLKVDKSPINFKALGMIDRVFPEAKIIHAKRHPMDVCLSIFQTPLIGYHTTFSRSLEEIGQFYLEYSQLMKYWKEVLPLDLLEVRYEDMVGDPQTHAQNLIAHIGLDWEEACLKERKSKRDVNTASVWQVRQDIYTSSVSKWQRYEKHLAPLKNILETEIKAYETIQ